MKYPEINQATGKTIRALRKEIKLTQAAVAEQLNISFQQVQKYETGTDRIAFSTLYVLLDVLGATAQEFHDTVKSFLEDSK